MKTLLAVLFPDFEVLGLAGQLEMFGNFPGQFEILTVGENAGPIRSSQGVHDVAESDFDACPVADFVLIPDGNGTMAQGRNP